MAKILSSDYASLTAFTHSGLCQFNLLNTIAIKKKFENENSAQTEKITAEITTFIIVWNSILDRISFK